MAEVRTSLGTLRGGSRGGIEHYLGIPYAAPPVGARRFLPPDDPAPWDGVREATRFGPCAPQPPGVEGSPLPDREVHWDEDCLFLNVYTPACDDARRPVLVWIHGGAYVRGSGDLYDGTSFAKVGDIVVVTLNYRMGVFGFVELGHLDEGLAGSANNGILDQIAALRWVREHISEFGGDPDQVTISGESAGAGSVMALLASPAADGLYHRAIAQSAPAGFGPLVPGAAETLLEAMGGGGLEALRTASAQELIDTQSRIMTAAQSKKSVSLFHNGGPGFRPVVDSTTVTRSAVEAVQAAGERSCPLLIGTNADEGSLFSFHLPGEIGESELIAALQEHCDDPGRVADAYAGAYPGLSLRSRMVKMNGDTMFRTPSLRVIDSQVRAGGAPVWVYLFTWKSRGFGGVMGAMHALEIPFVWKQDLKFWAAIVGEGNPEPPDLADQMHEAWIAFTRNGDPNHPGIPAWPAYELEKRPTMEFGSETVVTSDPDGATRACWN